MFGLLSGVTGLFTGKVAMYLCAAAVAAASAMAAYQYIGRMEAEKVAQTAQKQAATAIAQTAIVSKTLEDQNAALAVLQKQLVSKQAEADATAAAAQKVADSAQAAIAALRTAAIPKTCAAASSWLRDQLRGGK